jgi:hypothetical protein
MVVKSPLSIQPLTRIVKRPEGLLVHLEEVNVVREKDGAWPLGKRMSMSLPAAFAVFWWNVKQLALVHRLRLDGVQSVVAATQARLTEAVPILLYGFAEIAVEALEQIALSLHLPASQRFFERSRAGSLFSLGALWMEPFQVTEPIGRFWGHEPERSQQRPLVKLPIGLPDGSTLTVFLLHWRSQGQVASPAVTPRHSCWRLNWRRSESRRSSFVGTSM